MNKPIIKICEKCQLEHAEYQIGETYYCSTCFRICKRCAICKHHGKDVKRCIECISASHETSGKGEMQGCLGAVFAFIAAMLIVNFEEIALVFRVLLVAVLSVLFFFVMIKLEKKFKHKSTGFEEKEDEEIK